MSKIIKTWRDPYDAGFSTCRKKEIELQPGLTVLVGCNGAGKTTLLRNIAEVLRAEKIPYIDYDNVTNGKNSISESAYLGHLDLAAEQLCSSEGENLTINLGKTASRWRSFLSSERVEVYVGISESNERWILLDAMDSGYSIDNVIEMKNLFNLVIEDAKTIGKELYIVISANEYELVDGSNCFDVMEGKYINFSSYENYKKFILHSRQKKDKRNK